MDWLERCVGDVQAFLHTHWRQGPALLRPADPPTEVLSTADIDGLIDGGLLRVPYAALYSAAGPVPEERYCPPRLVAGRRLDGCLDPGRVRALISDENATLQLRYLDHWHDPARALAHGVGARLGRLAEAFVFRSHPGRSSAVHRDDGDVLVIQLSGSKRWQVYGGPADAHWQPVPEADPGPVLLEATVEPGQVLYVPNGFAHAARATGSGPSLHLTVVLREARVSHLRTELAARLAAGLALPARPLDDEELTRTAAALLGHFRTRLAGTTPQALVDAARRSAHSSRPTA
ncbi:JmjC domain-containing protein [Streptomyces sp. NPDC008001]|uniref:JmjC domain-containing protein n=1 Tax=Streptomyces sp. NPDC008001 TaxID=3364804 RepID=UPI0036EDB467